MWPLKCATLHEGAIWAARTPPLDRPWTAQEVQDYEAAICWHEQQLAKRSVPQLEDFCADAVPAWCAQRREEGRCARAELNLPMPHQPLTMAPCCLCGTSTDLEIHEHAICWPHAREWTRWVQATGGRFHWRASFEEFRATRCARIEAVGAWA